MPTTATYLQSFQFHDLCFYVTPFSGNTVCNFGHNFNGFYLFGWFTTVLFTIYRQLCLFLQIQFTSLPLCAPLFSQLMAVLILVLNSSSSNMSSLSSKKALLILPMIPLFNMIDRKGGMTKARVDVNTAYACVTGLNVNN